jgi:hypothetical protein
MIGRTHLFPRKGIFASNLCGDTVEKSFVEIIGLWLEIRFFVIVLAFSPTLYLFIFPAILIFRETIKRNQQKRQPQNLK